MVSDHQRRIYTPTFTLTEQRIVDFICLNPGCTQQDIREHIYGRLRTTTRVVEVHLSRIKHKLERTSTNLRLISYRDYMTPQHCYEIHEPYWTVERNKGQDNAPTILPPILP